MISAPVRHGKSQLVSVWLPAWILENNPTWPVIIASYGAELAEQFGRQVKQIFEHSPGLWTRLSDDSTAAGRWNTKEGGGLVSCGVGGALIGRGGKVIIVDDPVRNAEEADSEIHRAKAKVWFDSTLKTRAEPGATIIVCHQRWHEDDLYAWLKESGDYEEICLPALAEDNDILGRKPGEALCPERFTSEYLVKLREQYVKSEGLRWWSALYQQRPSSSEGSEIKRSWWRFYEPNEKPNHFEFICASWDAAFKDGENSDYVVGQIWGVYGNKRYLLDQIRDKLDFVATVAAIRSLGEKWRPNAVLIEDKANGSAILNVLSKSMGAPGARGVPLSGIIPINPMGSKVARVRAVSPQIQAGNVFLPRSEKFSQELVEECAAFPLGKHDDQADCLSQALSYLLHMGGSQTLPVHYSPDKFFMPPGLRGEQTPAIVQMARLGLASATGRGKRHGG